MPVISDSSSFLNLGLLSQGGPTIIPLLCCSVLAVAIVIERFLNGPKKERVIPSGFRSQSLGLLEEARHEQLTGLCGGERSPAAKLVETAVESSHLPRPEIESALEIKGRAICTKLDRFTDTLGTIAAISPLLGLLGTVFGMIEIFQVISAEGAGDAQKLAGGISQALISTAAGLSVAIPSLIFSRFFKKKHLLASGELEQFASELLRTVERSKSQVDEVRVGNEV